MGTTASREEIPPIQALFTKGELPMLMACLTWDDQPDVQLDSAWSLCNVASGTPEQIQSLVDLGAIEVLASLLASLKTDPRVKDSVVWAIGNMATDNGHRDRILEAGILEHVLAWGGFLAGEQKSELKSKQKSSETVGCLRNVVWTLSNMFRGLSIPSYLRMQKVILFFGALLHCKEQDQEILMDLCWGLSYLSHDLSSDFRAVQLIVDAKLGPPLIALLSHEADLVKTPALRTVGNIMTGTDSQTQVMLDAGVLDSLAFLLLHPSPVLRRETCWTLSNVVAGSSAQMQRVLGSDANFLRQFVRLLQTEGFNIQREVVFVFYNMIHKDLKNLKENDIRSFVSSLISEGVVESLLHILPCYDVKVIGIILDSYHRNLEASTSI